MYNYNMNELIAEVICTFLYITVSSVAGRITKRVNTYPICYLILSVCHVAVVTVLFAMNRIEPGVFTRLLIVMFPGGFSTYSIAKGPLGVMFPDDETIKLCGLAVWFGPFFANVLAARGDIQNGTLMACAIGLILVAVYLLSLLIKYNPPRDND